MSGNTAQHRDFSVVDPDTMDWIDARASWIVDQFGWERIRSCPVVLPTPEFFPAPYSADEEGARAMLDQLCCYLDLDPERVEMKQFYERARVDGGMTALGLYQEESDRFVVWVRTTLLHEPEALAATMSHELCHIHLLGHGRVTGETDDHEPLTDLLTVFLGLGVLSANAALWERSDQWMWQIARHGYLRMPMYGYALALFAMVRGEDRPAWSKHLRPDVRDAFRRSLDWLSQHGLPDLQSVRTTVARPRFGGIDAESVEPTLPETDEEGLCRFCGVQLPEGLAEDVCEECRASIDENDLNLESDRRAGGTPAFRKWHRYRLIILSCMFAAVVVMALIGFMKFL